MKLLREPLIQFVALGTALLLIYSLGSGFFSSDPNRQIRITESDIALLAENFRRTWQRPPTEGELTNLINARIREEVL